MQCIGVCRLAVSVNANVTCKVEDVMSARRVITTWTRPAQTAVNHVTVSRRELSTLTLVVTLSLDNVIVNRMFRVCMSLSVP